MSEVSQKHLSRDVAKELVDRANTEELVELAKEYGGTILPRKWAEFTLESQRIAVGMLLIGAWTGVTFALIRPDFTNPHRRARKLARKCIEKIEEQERERKKPTHWS